MKTHNITRITIVLLSFLISTSLSCATTSSPGCGKSLPDGQALGKVSNISIQSKDTNRSYLIFIPPTYNISHPTPLILSYHGGDRTALNQLELDQLASPYFNNNSIVVYPQGINNKWQGVANDTSDDLSFTATILTSVNNNYCINASVISATRKSDGGSFVNLLACDHDLSTKIAAFAPVSGAYYVDTSPCHPDNMTIPCSSGRDKIPLLAFHGGNDTTIPYSGEEKKGECLPSIPHFIQEWAS